MPVTCSWGNPEKSIIIVAFAGTWTLEEYHSMIDTTHNMLATVNHPVHFISDFTSSTSSPVKLLSAGRHMETSGSARHPDMSVAVQASGFIKAISGIIQKLFLKETQMYFADSMDEAYCLIERHQAIVTKTP